MYLVARNEVKVEMQRDISVNLSCLKNTANNL